MKYFSLFLVLFTLISCKSSKDERPVMVVPAVQPAESNIIFRDNFDTHKNKWVERTGRWKWIEGFLSQTTSDPRELNSIIYLSNPQMADGSIETLVRINFSEHALMDNPAHNRKYIVGAGIIFRMQDINNYYMFRLAGETGAVLGKMVDGEWIDIKNPRAYDFLEGEVLNFGGNNWYNLKVELKGNRIICYVQNSAVINAIDDTYSIGKVGLVTFKAAADFDFITLKSF